MQHMNLLLGEWVGLSLSFLSYFYLSYYDIEVPCKLLPPCWGGHTSLQIVKTLESLLMENTKNKMTLFWSWYLI